MAFRIQQCCSELLSEMDKDLLKTCLIQPSSSKKSCSTKSTLGITLSGLAIHGTTVGGPAHSSKQLSRGDVIVKIDGVNVNQDNIRRLLIGDDAPGTPVTIVAAKGGIMGRLEEVKLFRASSDTIKDNCHMSDLLCALKDRAVASGDTVSVAKADEALELWNDMCTANAEYLAQITSSMKAFQQRGREMIHRLQQSIEDDQCCRVGQPCSGLAEGDLSHAPPAGVSGPEPPPPPGAAFNALSLNNAPTGSGETPPQPTAAPAPIAEGDLGDKGSQALGGLSRGSGEADAGTSSASQRSLLRMRLSNAAPPMLTAAAHAACGGGTGIGAPPGAGAPAGGGIGGGLNGGVGGVGMMIRRVEGSPQPVVVEHVTSGGPAARCGIRRGDRLLAVDGRDVTHLPTGAIAALIAGVEGTPVFLVVARGPLSGDFGGGLWAGSPTPSMEPFGVQVVRHLVEDAGLLDAGPGILGI